MAEIDPKVLSKFAKECGVKLVACDPEWGGKVAYKEEDQQGTVCGFRTENAAYKHWLESTFGDRTGRAVLKLLRASAREAK